MMDTPIALPTEKVQEKEKERNGHTPQMSDI